MTDNHPITPPQWLVDAWRKLALAMGADVDAVFLEAARWGADQELKACCELMDEWELDQTDLRFARRPKPPSLKEQALEALDRMDQFPTAEDQYIIRRALEQLDD
jgi:hypothetical protein